MEKIKITPTVLRAFADIIQDQPEVTEQVCEFIGKKSGNPLVALTKFTWKQLDDIYHGIPKGLGTGKIGMVRLVKDVTGLSLIDAKHFVERNYVFPHPETRPID